MEPAHSAPSRESGPAAPLVQRAAGTLDPIRYRDEQRERVVSDFEAFFRSADARLKPEALDLSDTDVQRMVNELR